jgi:dienelactone hydrolase
LNIHCMGLEADLQGWAYWPGREELSIEFSRLLGAAQEGGATVAECFATAGRIDFSDDHSWYQEWKKTADASYKRGNEALGRGNLLTARSNWLRAINYYQAAASPLDLADETRQVAVARMRACAGQYVQHGNPRGEVVSIRWPGGYALEGYFLPAPAAATSNAAPAIICIGEPGQRKEEYLFKVARHAADRGIALLAVDLFGSGPDSQFAEAVGRTDLETTIGHITDYLVERHDVDKRRVAILADGWGSSFVARGIAFDDRFVAAVCDGGIWDLHEQAFLSNRLAYRDAGPVGRARPSRAARNIKCPVLISAGERGWLKAERVRELYEELEADGRDVTLKIFTCEETAAAQGHADNPTLANEFIFDWLAAPLGISA